MVYVNGMINSFFSPYLQRACFLAGTVAVPHCILRHTLTGGEPWKKLDQVSGDAATTISIAIVSIRG